MPRDWRKHQKTLDLHCQHHDQGHRDLLHLRQEKRRKERSVQVDGTEDWRSAEEVEATARNQPAGAKRADEEDEGQEHDPGVDQEEEQEQESEEREEQECC